MPTLNLTTAVRQARDVWSTHKVIVGQYTGPTAYVTGGDSFAPADLGWNSLDVIVLELAINAAGTIYGLVHENTTNKILWYVLSTGAEVANGTNLSGFSSRFLAAGHG